MTELQTCSPFVIGQSRPEYDAYIELYGSAPHVDDILGKNKTDTTVNFSILLRDIPTPRAEMPKFPILGSTNGNKILAIGRKRGVECCTEFAELPIKTSDEPCPVVHELCALNMFRNRVRRSRHSIRRCRREIEKRVIHLTGIKNDPLGIDEHGFTYWKFAMCDDLFICTHGTMEPGEFKKSIFSEGKRAKPNVDYSSMLKNESNYETLGIPCRWIRISDIRILVCLVFNCMSDETLALSSLRRRVASLFLTPERLATLTPHGEDSNISEKDDSSTGGNSPREDVDEGEDNDDQSEAESRGSESEIMEDEEYEVTKEKRGKPTKLVLQRKKGCDVPKRSIIQQVCRFLLFLA